jgi:hypothetical protein
MTDDREKVCTETFSLLGFLAQRRRWWNWRA